MDSVLCLESEIRKAMANKEVLVGVFFDVEKAYDMLWKEGVLIKLDNMGIKGKMYNWIMDFLFNRTIQVRVGTSYSSIYRIDNGTPQGSVCSPVLFNFMINDIFSTIGQRLGKSLYADDGALWKRGRNIEYVEKSMQKAVNEVENWVNKWSFRLSVEKTKVICFSKKRKSPNIKINLYGQTLEQVTEIRFLGVWMDTKLTFASHIKKVQDKCKKGINILRCLAGVDWGATRQALQRVYCAMIRPIIDYGNIVYSSASESLLKKVSVIQSQALRIGSGAFCTSPVSAMQVEMAEMPLKFRTLKLKMTYWNSVRGHGDTHPVKEVLQKCWEHEHTKYRSFGWNADMEAKEIGIDCIKTSPTVVIPAIPPWLFQMPLVDLQLHSKINDKNRCMTKEEIVDQYLQQKYFNCTQIYTDGSKNPDNGYTGAAIYIPYFKHSVVKRLSNNVSVFTTEMVAILMAMQWVEEIQPISVVVCSDSYSALNSLKSGSSASRQDILYEILLNIYRINQMGVSVEFVWIPAHVGIEGNEEVDKLAKTALKKEGVEIDIPLCKSEIKSIVKAAIIRLWQEDWNKESKGRHLFNIQSKVGKERRTYGNRKEDTVITRLRIGHSKLNCSMFIIGKSDSECCSHCGRTETVEHVLLYCEAYRRERNQLVGKLKDLEMNVISVKDIFQNAQKQSKIYGFLLKFLRDTGLINRI
jgi:ribonuclease HI